MVRAWFFGPLVSCKENAAPEAQIVAKNDHKGRRDSRERELSRTVCFAGLRGRILEAFAEMVG